LGNFPIGGIGIPEAKAVVMLGEKKNVAHAGILGDAAPLVGITAGGIEPVQGFDVVGPFHVGKGAEGPADEHAETQILQLFGALSHIYIYRAGVARRGLDIGGTTDDKTRQEYQDNIFGAIPDTKMPFHTTVPYDYSGNFIIYGNIYRTIPW
jgi:hypothetical protein